MLSKRETINYLLERNNKLSLNECDIICNIIFTSNPQKNRRPKHDR